jgi:hypothetical protein
MIFYEILGYFMVWYCFKFSPCLMILTPRNDSVPDIPGTAAEPDDDDEEEAMVAEQLRSTAAMARLPMFRGYEPPHSAGMLSMIHHPPI